jgi:hypothetical protein
LKIGTSARAKDSTRTPPSKASASDKKSATVFQIPILSRDNTLVCDICSRSETVLNRIFVCSGCKVVISYMLSYSYLNKKKQLFLVASASRLILSYLVVDIQFDGVAVLFCSFSFYLNLANYRNRLTFRYAVVQVNIHLDCYHSLKNPRGPWRCDVCEQIPPKETSPSSNNQLGENIRLVVRCALCGNSSGAFRKTTDGPWVHAFCAEVYDMLCMCVCVCVYARSALFLLVSLIKVYFIYQYTCSGCWSPSSEGVRKI